MYILNMLVINKANIIIDNISIQHLQFIIIIFRIFIEDTLTFL